MRILVIGKAKTGTTLLSYLASSAIGAERIVMEPKSVLEFGSRSINGREAEVIKIIFEHYRNKYRHLNAIVHAEFGFSVDKVIFITRDVRDEMVSRLLYFSKVLPRQDADESKWIEWISILERKEEAPERHSFQSLCQEFYRLFCIDVWSNIISHVDDSTKFEDFISNSVKRDYIIAKYESIVKDKYGELESYIGKKINERSSDVDLNTHSYTKRTATFDNWRRYFTDEDVSILRPIIRGALQDDRYDNWDLERPPALPAEHYSGYVKRMVFGGAH